MLRYVLLNFIAAFITNVNFFSIKGYDQVIASFYENRWELNAVKVRFQKHFRRNPAFCCNDLQYQLRCNVRNEKTAFPRENGDTFVPRMPMGKVEDRKEIKKKKETFSHRKYYAAKWKLEKSRNETAFRNSLGAKRGISIFIAAFIFASAFFSLSLSIELGRTNV